MHTASILRTTTCALLIVLGFEASGASTFAAMAWPPSVAPGDSVRISVSAPDSVVQVRIVRDGNEPLDVRDYGALEVRCHADVDSLAYRDGVDWPSLVEFDVPADWSTGFYFAKITSQAGENRFAPFIVRAPADSGRRILVALALPTWQAYNEFGSKSLYDFNSVNGRALVVSQHRPYVREAGLGHYERWPQHLVRWMEAEGYAFDVCSTLDIGRNPGLLDSYQLLVLCGHDEYWTRDRRLAVESFVDRGGNLASLAGNACWWQIRTGPASDLIECYRKKENDPLWPTRPELTTIRWYETPLDWPATGFLGVDWRRGGYVDHVGMLPSEKGYGGYTVVRPQHWVFEGTGLDEQDVFGQPYGIVGYEVDGAELLRGVIPPQVSGVDGAPPDFQVLAMSDATKDSLPTGNALMGIIEREGRGTIFNAATTDWVQGLDGDPAVRRITSNVLTRLSKGRGMPVPRLSLFGNVGNDEITLWWEGDSLGSMADLRLQRRTSASRSWQDLRTLVPSTNTRVRLDRTNLDTTARYRLWARLSSGIELVSEEWSPPQFLATVYPNPFVDRVRFEYRTGPDESPSPIHVRVLDLRGRRVLESELNGLSTAWTWNGRSESGDTVAAGNYWVEFVSDSRVRRFRVLKLKPSAGWR